MGKPNLFIICICSGRSDEDEFAVWAELLLGEALQLLANALSLIGFMNGKVGEVAGIVKVGHAACDADKLFALPCADDEVAVFYDPFHALAVVHWAAFCKCGVVEQFDELLGGDGCVFFVFDAHLAISCDVVFYLCFICVLVHPVAKVAQFFVRFFS